MNHPHLDGANSALRSRDRRLVRFHLAELDHLSGIEHKLYGYLLGLSETVTEPDLTDEKHRLLNLCLLAFQPGFQAEAKQRAADLMSAGVPDWAEDLLKAIDITGACHWRPVIQALLQHEDLSETLYWRLLTYWPDSTSPEQLAGPLRWTGAQFGEIAARVRLECPDWTDFSSEIRDSFTDPDRQEDLLWLVLGGLVDTDKTAAHAMLRDWLIANPNSTDALCAATVSGDPDYNDVLQLGVRDGHIPAFWLAVHGQSAHLEFCLNLLRNPADNRQTEAAWYGLTGQRLSRVPGADLGLPAASNKKKQVLADFRMAQHWLQQHQPQGRLCLGQDHTERPFRPQLGLFFGEWARPAALSLWVDSGGTVFTRHTECHWRRVRALREATV
ncbi:hypothetical protein [Saccharospirillum salsuginis]|uniref:Uncharacterized protein n=1 Tax=Saccharospirillum salsuginis TaxID=418750 RepID=A0A918K9B1_9GAMM|nr:hypothetical protein [Saccharospirillum salsuginis]GGX52582.1 hypothetical protein GCM10007392_19940 [Saccharospirillum salsuginis]